MEQPDYTFVVTYRLVTGKAFIAEVCGAGVVQLGPFEANEIDSLVPTLFPDVPVVALTPQCCKLDDGEVLMLGNALLPHQTDTSNVTRRGTVK